MAAVQALDIVQIGGATLISANQAEKKSDKSPDKIEIHFAIRKWLPKQGEVLTNEIAKVLKIDIKVKVDPPLFKKLKELGLKVNSSCDLELASNGWASDKDAGNWYQFLGLLKLNGREINYFIYRQDNGVTSFNGFDSSDWQEQEVVEEIS